MFFTAETGLVWYWKTTQAGSAAPVQWTSGGLFWTDMRDDDTMRKWTSVSVHHVSVSTSYLWFLVVADATHPTY